jgi:hypothetical protein
MDIEDFLNLAENRDGGFVCTIAGARNSDRTFVAEVEHILNSPSSQKDLTVLENLLPSSSEEIIAFYERHNGFQLYRDTKSDAVGLELLSIDQIETETKNYKEWVALNNEFLEDNPEFHLDRSIALAWIPKTPDYFVTPVTGDYVGQLFLVKHDEICERPYAKSFNDFLAKLFQDPVKLINDDLGFMARYSDGKTPIEWKPIEWLDDVNSLR